MGIGTANRIVVDAKVLSGNTDDKTYNFQNLDEIDNLLKRTKTDKNSFYYIADSALFTENNILKAKDKKIKFITRIPEAINITKELIRKSLETKELRQQAIFLNAQNKEVKYDFYEYTIKYKGTPCKCAVCYSYNLEETKRKTISKKSIREKVQLEKLVKQYIKREFACKADAQKEIDGFNKKVGKKLKFYELNFTIESKEKRKAGRPSKDQSVDNKTYIYNLKGELSLDKDRMEESIKEACCFVLISNDLDISAENLLKEYKTQSSVEKKFHQLKSPSFVNFLFLKTPERVEALTYMMLITMMMLSVIEPVVRRELREENEIVIGPGKIKMKRPTLRAIVEIFNSVAIKVIQHNGDIQRIFQSPLKDSQLKIMKYLGLKENIFIGGDI